MKKLLAAILAVTGFMAGSNTALAGFSIHVGYTDHYVSGRGACGCPIYTKRVCRGFDHYRRPIYGYYRQPFRCGCRPAHHVHRGCNSYNRYYPRHHGRHTYHRGNSYYGRYGYGHGHRRHPNRCR